MIIAFFVPFQSVAGLSLPINDKASVQVVVDVVSNYLSQSEAKSAQDVTVQVTGNGANPASFKGSEAPGTRVSLKPGEYKITALNSDSRYSLSMADDCQGIISSKQKRICTIILYNLPNTGVEQPQLRLITYVINDNGGSNHPSDFINHVSAGNLFPGSYYGEESPGIVIYLNGDYKVNQNSDSRYNTTFSKQCSGHAADFRRIQICTVTNDDKPNGGGTLNVLGEVVNNNGGIRNIEEFVLSAKGRNVSNQIFITNERPGIALTMEPGWYNVTEEAMWGYTVKFLGDCHGFMKAWETKICKVVNDDIPGNGGLLTIVQRVINDEEELEKVGGPIIPEGIPDRVTAEPVIREGIPSGNISAEPVIREGIPSGNISAGVSTLGDSYMNQSLFTIVINGSSAFPTLIDGKENFNGTEVALKNGSYIVSANSISKNYSYSFSPECTANMKNGQGKICVMTADDLSNQNNSIGKLIIVHRVINNDGLGRAPISFASSVSGNCLENCRSLWYNESLPLSLAIKEYHMNEGNYQVTYHMEPDYQVTPSGECDGIIHQGEVKTCQLTIDDKPRADASYGTLIVKQHVVNNNGSNKTANDFKIYIAPHYVAPNQTSFGGTENGTTVRIKVPITTSEYIVTQEAPENYISYFSRDCANIIREGETNLCLITSYDR